MYDKFISDRMLFNVLPIAVGKNDIQLEICTAFNHFGELVIWFNDITNIRTLTSGIYIPYRRQTFKKYKLNREVCDIIVGHLLNLNRYFAIREKAYTMDGNTTIYTYVDLTPEEKCIIKLIGVEHNE